MSTIPPESPHQATGVGQQIPIILLERTTLNIANHPSGVRMLTIGPVVLALPLSEETERWLADAVKANSSGLIIARQPLPTTHPPLT